MAIKAQHKLEDVRFTTKRARMSAILDALYEQPHREFYSRSGQATESLFRALPVSVLQGRGEKLMVARAFATQLREMEEWDWIKRDINGKRTNRISLNVPPSDWRPPAQNVVTESPVEQSTEPADEADERQEPDVEQEAREGGIRPGRLAARLEKIEDSIPALVEEGVVQGMKAIFVQLGTTFGAQPQSVTQDELVELTARLSTTVDMVTQLEEELRAERNEGHKAREAMNAVLRRQYATRDTTDMRPNDLPEAWRSLGAHAISNGWTLHRTGGGHIMWKAPTGERYFSSSTSSDYRSVRNARSDMEKMGLPKE